MQRITSKRYLRSPKFSKAIHSLDEVKIIAKSNGVCQYRTHNIADSTKYSFKCNQYRRYPICIYELKATVPDDDSNSITIMFKNAHNHEYRNDTTCVPSPVRQSVAKYVEVGLTKTQIRSALLLEHPNLTVPSNKLTAIVQTERRKKNSNCLELYDRRDIRVRGGAYFLFLSSLCQISKATINNAINQCLNETLINTWLISKSDFQIQINNIILQFKNNTLTKFSQSFKLIHLKREFYTFPSQGIYYKLINQKVFSIPGWNIGCSVVDTLLQSTFECLYDQNCINSLLFHIKDDIFKSSPINISAMNSSMKSRFKINTTIQNIADQLFIEDWKINSSYLSFYNQCVPIFCCYTIERDDYVSYTVFKILGLYGGLTIVL
ncbi:hypothetical protein I4U23_005310 [Adineta vaga]|nr:hypothetical protein I4U23_005310 [Adineta vaga]